jgi:hypothetical protein
MMSIISELSFLSMKAIYRSPPFFKHIMTSPFGKGGLRGILWKDSIKKSPQPLFTKEGDNHTDKKRLSK